MSVGRPRKYVSRSVVTVSMETKLADLLYAEARERGINMNTIVSGSLVNHFKEEGNNDILPPTIRYDKQLGSNVCTKCNETFDTFIESEEHLCLFGYEKKKEVEQVQEQPKETPKIIVPEADKEAKRRSNVLLYGGFGF